MVYFKLKRDIYFRNRPLNPVSSTIDPIFLESRDMSVQQGVQAKDAKKIRNHEPNLTNKVLANHKIHLIAGSIAAWEIQSLNSGVASLQPRLKYFSSKIFGDWQQFLERAIAKWMKYQCCWNAYFRAWEVLLKFGELAPIHAFDLKRGFLEGGEKGVRPEI